MANENTQLNSFSNLYEDRGTDSSMPYTAGSTKKVTFNTAASSNYVTNEAYKTLRTNIFFCGKDIKTILITSCKENEGKSTVSTELCKSLAESGKRTLLIDCDMRKSVLLKKNVKTKQVTGLSEVLSGLADIKDVLYHTQYPNFNVVFAGHFPPNPVELIGQGRLESLLEQLKPQYDYIIIDSPPLGIVIDAAVIATCCDGAVLLISNKNVNRSLALQVKNQLEKSGCKILGAIMNDAVKKGAYYSKKYYADYKYK